MLKPGDRIVATSRSAFDKCEGTVTFSRSKSKDMVKVLITADPVGSQEMYVSDVGNVINVPEDTKSWNIIPTNPLHKAIDTLLPFV